jgi:hypothetical protein
LINLLKIIKPEAILMARILNPFLQVRRSDSFGQSIILFHGDPLIRRVTEIIGRVVGDGL